MYQNPVSLFEEFVGSGQYHAWKQSEHYFDAVKKEFKRFLSNEDKRREFTGFGLNLVAKYRRVPVYEVDHEALNRYLHEYYGLLTPVASIDNEIKKNNPDLWDALSCYQLPVEWFVKFTPNKAGRVKKVDMDYSTLKIRELGSAYYDLQDRVRAYETSYEEIKTQLERDKELRLCKKLQTRYGSLSLQTKKPEFRLDAILEDYGEDFLIENARVKLTLLDRFIERGYIRPKEIDQFRKMTNIRLSFVVQDLEVEQKQLEMLNSKMHRVAETLRNIG